MLNFSRMMLLSIYAYWCSDRVAAITANFQATTSIGNLVSISSSNTP